MRHLLDRLLRSPSFRFAALLLLTALVLIGTMGFSARPETQLPPLPICSSECIACFMRSCVSSLLLNGIQDDGIRILTILFSWLGEQTIYQPGERASVSFIGEAKEVPGEEKPTKVTLAFSPPKGATNLDFGSKPPDRQDGDVYYWDNVPVDESGATPPIEVGFNVGQQEGNVTAVSWAEWTDSYGDTHTQGGASEIQVRSGAFRPAPEQALAPQPARTRLAPQAENGRFLWKLEIWTGPGEETALTEAVWNEWLGRAPDGTPFIGLRVPLGASGTYTNSYHLPVVMDGERMPRLVLVSYEDFPWQAVYTQTLVYRPEYIDVLANAYPQQADTYWVALGLPSDAPLNAPAGLDIPAGDWEVRLDVWLDLGIATIEELQDAYIYLYGGFEGDGIRGATLLRPLLKRSLGTAEGALYQGEGLTIIGPLPLRLRSPWSGSQEPDPPIQIRHHHAGRVQPGERISVAHSLANLSHDGAVEVQLAVSTTLGSTVGLYAGDWSAPTLPLEPLSSMLTLNGGESLDVWLIGTVPEGTQGVETWQFVGRIPGESYREASMTNLFWVGEWMTPPPGDVPPALVFLPMAIR